MKKKNVMFALISAITAVSMIFNTGSGIFAEEKEPVEIISLRSEYEKHFSNSDGTKTAFISTAPIHYFENGTWEEIDNTLCLDKNGNYTNAKNSMDVTLAANASSKSLNTIDDNHLVSLAYEEHNLSWDLIQNENDVAYFSSYQKLSRISPIQISEYSSESKLKIADENIERLVNKKDNNANSSVQYVSISDSCDINIDVTSRTVKQDVIIKDKNSAQQELNFYFKANGLTATIDKNNSINFSDETGNSVYNISAPYVCETTNDKNQSSAVTVSLDEYDEGYIITYSPEEEWTQSEERAYPLSLRQDIYLIADGFTTSTISEAAPQAQITDGKLKMGGSSGNRYGALISFPSTFLFSSDYITITGANLYIYINSFDDSEAAANGLEISSVLSRYYPYWSSISPTYLAQVDRFQPQTYNYNEIDISITANAWQNYYRSNSKVGTPSYAFVIKSYFSYCAVYEADTLSDIYPPHYIINYVTDTDYTSTYSPSKYDDCSDSDGNVNDDIYNFNDRMNCYTYALQVYDQNHINGEQPHKLMPGEISISANSQFSTCTQLRSHYNSIDNISDLKDFTEQQMFNDSQIMGSNLQKITLENNAQFVLPNTYNESTQRIIAMNVGTNYPSGSYDFHFYLRHGNGTCDEHGGTCSIWSHKLGNESVSNLIENTVICDSNIAYLASYADIDLGLYSEIYYNSPVRFYTTQQDMNVYNSWYVYNSNSDTTIYVDY